jgi:flavin reductase (DIM6/NTAB) family NADH-FMN oxidoreductase RutF
MFFQAGKHVENGLPHDPFKAIVAPRPIGWISTRASNGDTNLAPYSFFNAVSASPPMVMFSSYGQKDTVTFARDSGVFAANFAGAALIDQMNASSAPYRRGVSEFARTALASAECEMIDAPRVRDACATLECRVTQIMNPTDLAGNATEDWVVFGQVVAIHLDDSVVTDGRFDVTKARPVSRLGYFDFNVLETIIELARP